jgi:uncharacterized membrane protein YeiH
LISNALIGLNQIPHILQKEIYATACIIGGILYFLFLKTAFQGVALEAVSIFIIVLIRLLAVKYNLSLPGIYPSNKWK